jgi:hypothetical protein
MSNEQITMLFLSAWYMFPMNIIIMYDIVISKQDRAFLFINKLVQFHLWNWNPIIFNITEFKHLYTYISLRVIIQLKLYIIFILYYI